VLQGIYCGDKKRRRIGGVSLSRIPLLTERQWRRRRRRQRPGLNVFTRHFKSLDSRNRLALRVIPTDNII